MPDTIVRDTFDARAAQAPAEAAPHGTPQFLFSSHYSGIGPTSKQASFERLLGAIFFHLLGIVAIWAVLKYTPAGSMLSAPMDSIPFHDVVWLKAPGPGGGGGGGGNRMQSPPKKADAQIPVAKAQATPFPTATPKEPPPPALDLAARPNDAVMVIPGSVDTAGDALSRGPGSGGGYGTGTGTGIGPGNGSGLGPGWGGGFGGGAYGPGSGATDPELLKLAKPQYTADAMRAKIQGAAVVECVVEADGSVGDCRILKSLDSVFGLDQEAIKAAKQFRFRPARLKGQPVAKIVNIELDFTLR
jgi:periplasmic protein TonB